ncbi:MAG: 3-hydroxybutyryl-CoA dehydratase [Thermoleophilaceae bacterium]|jgi:acyl dehydratase|nr:3-hydroxybutyryl-CoA dehydratase [Thermoleophilaceae bacterium]
MSVLAAEFDSLAVGDSFVTRGRTVTETDVVSFACLSGDMHPQHTDAAWAASSMFGERIAHGMLVASLALGLPDFDSERVVALRRVRDAVFKRPVAFGDTVHVAGRVDRLEPLNAATGLVGVRLDVLNQRDRTVARLGIEVLWRRGDGTFPAIEEPFELSGLPI